MAKKKKRKDVRKEETYAGWTDRSRFMWDRSTKNRQILKSLERSHVSLAVPGRLTHREEVTRIARSATWPIEIESLTEALDTIIQSRASTHFNFLGNVLNQVAENYSNMRWWISERGLNMAIVPPESMLTPFDAIAGSLCDRYWKNGKLATTDLRLIATELDDKAVEMGGCFLDRFAPAAREKIGKFNSARKEATIRTFAAAIANPVLVRPVRQRLYRARERFVKARNSGL